MTNFLLIHGPWHNSQMWQEVTRRLEAAGETHAIGRIMAPDLPGHGLRKKLDISRITLERYIEAAVTPARINLLTDVTVVAHSFAASFMPQVAAKLGDALSGVTLIGGIAPTEGSLPFNEVKFPLTHRLTRLVFRHAEKGILPPPAFLKRSLYNDIGGDEADIRTRRLTAEPYLPWFTPTAAPAYPTGVAVTYVALARDRLVPLRRQREYAAGIAGANVIELDAGHMAPVTRPWEVANLLLQAVPAAAEPATAQ